MVQIKAEAGSDAILEVKPKRVRAVKAADTPKKPRAPKKAAASSGDLLSLVSEEEQQRMIAEAAYFRAERRGFHPGFEHEDWLAAQEEISARLRGH